MSLVQQSLHDEGLAASHQGIDPKYRRSSLVLCQASKSSRALMRAPYDLYKSGRDTEMNSLVLLTGSGVFADMDSDRMRFGTTNEGLIQSSTRRKNS